MNSVILFSLLYLLFEIKHFVNGFDVRKDIWYRNTEDKSTFSDDIRCFCNLPQCVTTGYMCRTARSGNNSGCFSEINKSTTIEPIITTATRHGCIELLNISNERYYCDKNPTKLKFKLSAQNKQNHRDYHETVASASSTSTTTTSTEFLLICCYEDMCNHIDNPENQKMKLDISENIDLSMNAGKYQSIHHNNLQQQQQKQQHQQQQLQQKQKHPIDIEQIQNQKQLSSSSSLQSSSSSQSPSTISMIFSSPGRSNNDDWFRVATIAVPICGAFILFSLIAIAIKILRTDRSTSISLKLDNNSTTSSSGGGGVGCGVIVGSSIPITTTNSTIKDCKLDRKFILLDNEAQIIKHHNLQHQHQQQSSSPTSSSLLSSPSSHLLEQYTINNCNSLLNSNNNCNNTLFDNNYCDKKNETRAKMNQLLNIQYTLLPQNSTINYNYDDNNLSSSTSTSSSLISSPSSLLLYHNHDKLSNNNYNIDIQSLINNKTSNNNYNSKLFYKNLNNNCNNNINISNNSSSLTSSSSASSLQNKNMMIIDKHNKIYAKDILSPICENWNDDDGDDGDDDHNDNDQHNSDDKK